MLTATTVKQLVIVNVVDDMRISDDDRNYPNVGGANDRR